MPVAVPAHRASERDQGERLSPDDQATQREAEFLERALLLQTQRASRQRPAMQGVCSNCAQACLPVAVYCDEDCRADHEWRRGLAARTGAAR